MSAPNSADYLFFATQGFKKVRAVFVEEWNPNHKSYQKITWPQRSSFTHEGPSFHGMEGDFMESS